ncbi:MAG TPA: hypothetical protein VGK93_09840 [Candidatus Eisenbacteria bacterium]|jgi:hypothetical protein
MTRRVTTWDRPAAVALPAVGGVAADPVPSGVLEFLPPSPNPARGADRPSFILPDPKLRVDVGIHDVGGRVVRFEQLGPRAAGFTSRTGDGRNGVSDVRGSRDQPKGARAG